MGRRKMESDLHRIKLETGTVYQTSKGGNYYFRYQINGERKCVSLKTANQEEALRKAKALLPTVQATELEVIASHVKVARKLAAKVKTLPLSQVWEVYSQHPQRAVPSTVREHLLYKSTLEDFIRFVGKSATNFAQISETHTMAFADHLRTLQISVSTHNRKIIRLRKIFTTLQEYREDDNPFAIKVILRKEREEQDIVVRRLAFTREQEEQIKQVLDDPKYKIINKPEIKVVFYIGMYTGQRLKDCVLLQWQNVDLQHKRIMVKQFKTGKDVSIPIAPPLYNVLLEAKERQIDSYVSPSVAQRYKQKNKQGKCIGDGLVNIDVMRVIRWIGVETSVAVEGRKKKTTVLGFHSLRHSFASFCAEAGIPKAVVVSILGADSSIIDRFYTHVGEEAQQAAMDAISGELNTSPHNKIKRVLEYIASRPKLTQELQEIEKILKA